MRKLFTTVLLIGTFFGLNAEDTIRSLIFTEWRGDSWGNAYMELTNVGETTLDLSRFTLFSMAPKTNMDVGVPANAQLRLSGTLAPGEVFLAIPVTEELNPDGLPTYRIQLEPYAELKAYKDESGVMGLEFDSISPYEALFRLWRTYVSGLYYRLDTGDSVLIDAVNNTWNQETGVYGGVESTVAGVPAATADNILVRKASIKRGNTNWETSRGVSAEDSEWIVIPEDAGGRGMPFTTADTHGDFSLDYTSAVVTIDEANSKIIVPWGIYKGDSLVAEFTLGPGMAWEYIMDDEVQDSAHVICQPGDILTYYACGNVGQVKELTIEIAAPAVNMAEVFPLRKQNETGGWNTPFSVSNYIPLMDTIGNVSFATRIDTLFKYLEKAENANWEIVFVDGQDRVDLMNGDILKVTAEDGTTIKEYFIKVDDYMANTSALLSAITWPDMPGWVSDDWKGDTIPNFNPVAGSYTIKLPYGTTSVPALLATPENLNAKVETERAVSLKGGLAERTTTFTVTAEDDTSVMVYAVTFEVMKDASKLQPYSPDPFIGEIVGRHQATGCFIELVNSGNTVMDMSQYLLVQSKNFKDPAKALTEYITDSDADYSNRYRKYVPGYKFTKDTMEWRAHPAVLEYDPNVDPLVEPGDVFIVEKCHTNPAKLAYNWAEGDVIITPSRTEMDALGYYDYMAVNPWDEIMAANSTAAEAFEDNHFLFKIVNDSIFTGEKGLVDPNDFELVDIFADPINTYWNIAGRNPDGIANYGKNLDVYRKPYVSEGVLTPGADWGTNDDDCSWVVRKSGVDVPSTDYILDNVGFHLMDPVTKYLSTVSSLNYIISDGFTLESVRGVVTGTSVDGFYALLIKSDENQTLVIRNNTDGAYKTGTDALSNGDTLIVTSADAENVTKYVLQVTDGGLDADALLVAADGTGYVITVNGETATISGVQYYTTLSQLLENLIKPASATLSLVDAEDNLVPLRRLNALNEYVDTKVSSKVLLDVVAENGTTRILYSLVLDAASNDAFVVSDVYDVLEENKVIADVADGTSVLTFFANIDVVTGASAKLVDKIGSERTLGLVAFDDRLVVTSQDESNVVEYYINFINETNPDAANKAPVVSVAFADSTLAPNVTIVISASAEDDGYPLEPGSLSYNWNVISGEQSNVIIENADQLTTNVTFTADGSYGLEIAVDDGDLVGTGLINFTVTSVGFGNISANALVIYPNPASEKLYIHTGAEAATLIRLTDVTGRVVYLANHTEKDLEIDLTGYKAGIYFIDIVNKDVTVTREVSIIK